jgi:predicted phosphoribosyltransferase
LGCPLDLVSVRKIGHPLASEYAIAAVTEEGHTVTNPVEVEAVDQEWFRHEALAQQQEARRRRLLYLHGRPTIPATDKVAIVVDDGLATGLTMFAAVGELRKARPRKIVVAVPVAPPATVRELQKLVDEVVALYTPEMFGAIGSFYLRFEQVSDAEVIRLMNSAVVVEQPR